MAEHDNDHKHGGSVATYILIALILGVITYVEFAIVEYDLPWLDPALILWALIIMSVAKFLMVVMFFMHLKGDNPTYSFFFSSGMAMALGIFIATAFMFTLPVSFSFVRGQFTPPTDAAHGEEHEGLSEEITRLIESDGYSRELATRFASPRPKDRALLLTPPEAAPAEYTLVSAQADADAAEGAEDAQDGGQEEAPEQEGAGDEAAAADEEGPDQEAADEEAAEDDAAAGAWDEALGEQVYSANCAACHQAEGQGVPGAFPPLAGHAPELVAADGGRTYLTHVLLFGLQGEIDVAGQTYSGMMPAWQQLSDEELAAVANHALHAWGNAEALPDGFEPIDADTMAERRDANLSPQDVLEEREGLELP